MKIAVIGLGRIGLVCALGLKKIGHHIFGYDNNEFVIQSLQNKKIPFFEPELQKELSADEGSFKIMSLFKNLPLDELDQIWICVPTPNSKQSQDLSSLKEVLSQIVESQKKYNLNCSIVIRSTVLPGTCEALENEFQMSLTYHPEFLAEGEALNGFLNPSRVVIGHSPSRANSKDVEQLQELYKTSNSPLITTDFITAEISKYAANIMLASRIVVLNEIQKLSHHFHANQSMIEECLALDPRLGSLYLKSGQGVGGPCLRKDIQALDQFLLDDAKNIELPVISTLIDSDNAHRLHHQNALSHLIQSVQPRRIVFDGLSYKRNTDDLTCSAQMDLLRFLLTQNQGLNIYILDENVTRDQVTPFLQHSVDSKMLNQANLQFVKSVIEIEASASPLLWISRHRLTKAERNKLYAQAPHFKTRIHFLQN